MCKSASAPTACVRPSDGDRSGISEAGADGRDTSCSDGGGGGGLGEGSEGRGVRWAPSHLWRAVACGGQGGAAARGAEAGSEPQQNGARAAEDGMRQPLIGTETSSTSSTSGGAVLSRKEAIDAKVPQA